MFEDDETSVQRRGVAKNELPVLQNLGSRDSSRMDVVVFAGSIGLGYTQLD